MNLDQLEELPRHMPGSPEWHESRREGLGGSEIAAVLGLSPWTSRFALWHYKAGILTPTDEDNAAMLWGRLLEEPIRQRYAQLHAVTMDTPGPFRRVDRPWHIASPDGLFTDPSGERVVYEGKTARDDVGWGEQGTDEVPIYYATQVRWYLDCLEIERAEIAVLIGGSTYREYVVHHDETDAKLMRDEAERFMASIAEDRRPPLDGHPGTVEAMRQLHPDIERRDLQVDPRLADEFVEARRALDDAEAMWNLQVCRMTAAMGTARRARYHGQTLATRQSRGDGLPFLVAGRKLPYIKG